LQEDGAANYDASEDLPLISVRKARKADMPSVFGMMELLFPTSRPRDLPGDAYLVAERKGILVGFCHYRLRENSCYIAGIGVLAQYREHGAGTLLLDSALRRIDRLGIQKTFLKVRALNPASKLYLKFGFFEKRSGDTLLLVRKRPS
jgi:N-acetylglutamate synthase-like GNAT family acetyltransferase